MKYIPIEKDLIPYTFDMDIAGDGFTFAVNYNERFDFFTMDLYKDDALIMSGEKIVYGRALFGTYPDEASIPGWPITPFDEAGKETRVGWDQLGNTVFLFLGDPDE